MEKILLMLGMKKGAAIAALIGSVCTLYFLPQMGFKKSLFTVFVGFSSSVYVTPLVVPYFPEGLENGVAFLVGLAGVAVLGVIFKIDWKGLVESNLKLFKIKK